LQNTFEDYKIFEVKMLSKLFFRILRQNGWYSFMANLRCLIFEEENFGPIYTNDFETHFRSLYFSWLLYSFYEEEVNSWHYDT